MVPMAALLPRPAVDPPEVSGAASARKLPPVARTSAPPALQAGIGGRALPSMPMEESTHTLLLMAAGMAVPASAVALLR